LCLYGSPRIDLVVFAAGEKSLHGVPFDAFNVPAVPRRDAFLARFFERPYAYAGVVAGRGEATVIWAETDPSGGLEIFNDAVLVC
jgi:hypothetical protein